MMKKITFRWAILVSMLLSMVESESFENCRSSPKFSTKTGYNMVSKSFPGNNKPRGYSAVQIYMVNRHGERYPGNDDMAEMKEFSKRINMFNSTISPSVKLKLPWYSPFNGTEDKKLADVGIERLRLLGKRLRQKYPELFTKVYNPNEHHFISTCVSRARDSASALGMGIFTGNGTIAKNKKTRVLVKTNPCDSDTVLKALDNCKRYKYEVDDNDNATIEVDKFEKGPEFRSVMESLKKKFGQPSMELSVAEVKLMFDVCAWEISMFNGSLDEGMCSMFSKDELSVVEYNEDMDDYYKRSTGHKISYETSCLLVSDILNSLRAKVNESVSSVVKTAIFRSGHSDTMIPLYALLDIYTNKVHMKASNYAQNKNRTFRGGCLAPFSANLYFILYKQNNGSNHRLQLYVNERLTMIPGCQSAETCDFSTVEKQYKSIVKKCDYENMCALDNSSSGTTREGSIPIYLHVIPIILLAMFSS